MDKTKPREPGLWMFSQGVRVSDSDEVEKAEAHLLELMNDPYYLEAFKRVKEKIPSHWKHKEKGGLAASIQWTAPKERRAGRTKVERPWAENILDSLDRLNKSLTLDLCKKIVDGLSLKKISDREKTEAARTILQTLKNHKKRRKTTG